MCFSADASQELGSIKMVILRQHTATELFVNLFVIELKKLRRDFGERVLANNSKFIANAEATGEPCNFVEPTVFRCLSPSTVDDD